MGVLVGVEVKTAVGVEVGVRVVVQAGGNVGIMTACGVGVDVVERWDIAGPMTPIYSSVPTMPKMRTISTTVMSKNHFLDSKDFFSLKDAGLRGTPDGNCDAEGRSL